ncbi:MAG: hypothetical protein QG589_28 [Patescibacteria group bacterium]|nr:hypothetical protein [Patescibacteria group bacterium]
MSKITTQKGFTLLIAIVTTAMLLLVSVVVINIALKQLLIVSANRESQNAFYIADSGIECALYWDTKNPTLISSFATTTAGSVQCDGETIIQTGTQTVPTNPTQLSLIGGGGSANPTSIFSVNFGTGCAIIQVTKSSTGTTTINSRGYNTCNSSARRYERGITISY